VKLNVFEKLDNGNDVGNPVFEIIGVMADARNQGLDDPTIPEAVIPYTITGAFGRGILVRTQGKPEALLESLRREIWAVDRGVALTFAGTLTGFLQQFSYAEPEFSVVLLTIFASVGLLLVAVGVYSVISFTVSRQTREIGIRMALGAERRDVLWMVSAMGLRLIALGVVVGLIASYAAARVLASQLTGVSRQDPVTLVAVIAIITLVGAAACIVPANRAAKVDPNDALGVD
jgi:ABC-type antimicrobial peptide transport system permease subunit